MRSTLIGKSQTSWLHKSPHLVVISTSCLPRTHNEKYPLWSMQWRHTEAEASLLGTWLLQNVSSYCSIVCPEFKKKKKKNSKPCSNKANINVQNKANINVQTLWPFDPIFILFWWQNPFSLWRISSPSFSSTWSGHPTGEDWGPRLVYWFSQCSCNTSSQT